MNLSRIPAVALLMAGTVFHASAQPSRTGGKPAVGADDSLSYATCPIVYPVDQSPAERGYHYIFYGNAFFINNEGYLLTAAHVLSQLNDAQPYILLRLPMAPPRLLRVTVVAADRDHDVALLRAAPNPFAGKYQVRFLPLLVEPPALALGVQASALRPSRLKDPHSFDAFSEDRPTGEVLGYQFTSTNKSSADSEVVLFSHDVLLGDSGAPVVSLDSQAVVGFVEGRWLRPAPSAVATPAKSSAGVGAAIPVHYAISLLQQHGVAWHPYVPGHPDSPAVDSASADSPIPQPLSLLAPAYPSQALLGGEVVLDALADRRGQLTDIRVIRGAPPFLEKALGAARTWSFLPARSNGEALETRIGIAFQFVANVAAKSSKSLPPSAGVSQDVLPDSTGDRGPQPSLMIEPASPPISGSEAAAILFVEIDPQGNAASPKVLRGQESVAHAAKSALSQWKFSPAKRAGAGTASAFISIPIFRSSSLPAPVLHSSK